MMCEKCGSVQQITAYHNGTVWRSRGCGYRDLNTDSGEHLHRYCRGCGYDWTATTGVYETASLANIDEQRTSTSAPPATVVIR